MRKKDIARLAIEALKKKYPDAICSLVYTDPFQLLVATRLAAQCTDARVNIVTPALFARFENVKAFAAASVAEVEEYIKSCGLFKTKARDIVAMAKMLESDFNSTVPDNMNDLLKLPGIGRKTANLILGDIFGQPAIVVDTHCIRITRRLGLHDLKDAGKIELELKKYLPPEESNDFCHRLVLFGREVCKAQNPNCHDCCMNTFCKTVIKNM